MGCSSSTVTPSSSYTYSDSEDDNNGNDIAAVVEKLKEIQADDDDWTEHTNQEKESTNSSIENLITTLVENQVCFNYLKNHFTFYFRCYLHFN